MRRLRATALATLLAGALTVPAAAQSYIGIMAGPSLSTMTGSFIENVDGVEWGVNFRGIFDVRLFGSTYLSTGVAFIQKGGSKLTLSITDTTTYGFKTAYLAVPFLLRPEFAIGDGGWHVAPFAGVQVGFNSGCSVKPGEELEFPYECADSLPGGTAEEIEFTIPVGVDFFIEFPGHSRFALEARIDIGVTNVLSQAAALGQTAKQNVFVLMFGFWLPLFEEK